MSDYKIPGVYVEEISSLPPAVASVATAIPVFVGYTARQPTVNEPTPISGFLEFGEIFGRGFDMTVESVELTATGQYVTASITPTHYLQSALRLFYANGGGRCYVMSLGTPAGNGTLEAPTDGIITTELLQTLAGFDEPTIVVFPDHPGSAKYGEVLQHCEGTKDRVAILDTAEDDYTGSKLRSDTGTDGLSYGATYTPWVRTALPKAITARQLEGTEFRIDGAVQDLRGILTDADGADVQSALTDSDGTGEAMLRTKSAIYRNILRGLDATAVAHPPSGAVAGVYASVDRTRGVWKAPANVSLAGVTAPDRRFTQDELAALNIDAAAGKSINAIRHFSGKGTLIFGARTLAGLDANYRYVSVRRLMNMIEESCAKACAQFVFEPNDANTWIRVRAMIENFLQLIWRDGGLQGATPEDAFRVMVGLGETMSKEDVTAGRMKVFISVAPVRPAEFIVLQFMQHLPTS